MIEYRTPWADEAAAIAALGRDTFIESFGSLYSAEDLALFVSNVYTPEVAAAELASPKLKFRIAEDEGRMVGLCKIGFGVTLDHEPGDKNIVELKQLYLFRTHQGAGVAQQLMDWAIAEAEAAGADQMLLSVYSDNPRAQRFYQKYGFDWIADTYFMVGNHRDDEFLYARPMR